MKLAISWRVSVGSWIHVRPHRLVAALLVLQARGPGHRRRPGRGARDLRADGPAATRRWPWPASPSTPRPAGVAAGPSSGRTTHLSGLTGAEVRSFPHRRALGGHPRGEGRPAQTGPGPPRDLPGRGRGRRLRRRGRPDRLGPPPGPPAADLRPSSGPSSTASRSSSSPIRPVPAPTPNGSSFAGGQADHLVPDRQHRRRPPDLPGRPGPLRRSRLTDPSTAPRASIWRRPGARPWTGWTSTGCRPWPPSGPIPMWSGRFAPPSGPR